MSDKDFPAHWRDAVLSADIIRRSLPDLLIAVASDDKAGIEEKLRALKTQLEVLTHAIEGLHPHAPDIHKPTCPGTARAST